MHLMYVYLLPLNTNIFNSNQKLTKKPNCFNEEDLILLW